MITTTGAALILTIIIMVLFLSCMIITVISGAIANHRFNKDLETTFQARLSANRKEA
tara:strand:+ start:193 stop:363 length:171 start_codon:yes stop_codon:yes gene_type:complete